MHETRSDYQSYLLRLRRVENAGHSIWWTSLESPTTGARHSFHNPDELFAFLAAQMGEDQPAPPTDEQTTSLGRKPVSTDDRDGVYLRLVEEALRRRNRELTLLNRASGVFSSTLDLDHILTAVLEEVRRLLGGVTCSIWLIDPESGALVCQQATGLHSELARGWRLAIGQGLVGYVAQTGEGLVTPDTRADPRHFEEVDRQMGMELRSILSIPLRVAHGIIGVLQVGDTMPDRFTADDLALLEPLAVAAANAIENARLVQTLHEHTLQLKAQNEDLDAFAHSVAHDLRQPLHLIIGYAELLRDHHATLTPDEVNSYSRMILQSGRKMDRIIDELLLLSGVRQMEVEPEPLNMAEIVAEAWQRHAPQVAELQAHLILPDEWPTVWGYGPWVEEVWVNYLSNALKYGGRPPVVECGFSLLASSPPMVKFWVRDNGPGISAEAQKRLFTPFTRLNHVHVSGQGLGLSIVQRIVKKLGGEVGVESQPGQGSMFYFTLPGVVL